jgi:hypothetical protein
MEEFKRSKKIFSKLDEVFCDQVVSDMSKLEQQRDMVQKEYKRLFHQDLDIDQLEFLYSQKLEDSSDQFMRALLLTRLCEINIKKVCILLELLNKKLT